MLYYKYEQLFCKFPYDNMPHLFSTLKSKVLKHIQRDTLKSIVKASIGSKTYLWGIKQPPNHLEICVVIALYKDMFGKSYSELLPSIKKFLPTSKKTLNHNQHVLRKEFGKWGEQQLQLGGLSNWRRVSKKYLPTLKNCPHLLMDSTDFQKSGKNSLSRKDSEWSYKCNGPGRRYMAIVDVSGCPRALFGGYSPKLYDAHWIEVKKPWIEKNLSGATVYADCHFTSAIPLLKNVNLVTPTPKPRGRKKKNSLKQNDFQPDTIKKNKQISKVRSRVEQPFGLMQSKFKALSQVFYEDNDQLDGLVKLAAGVIAFEKE
jgi:DDE superfamily endonuclease